MKSSSNVNLPFLHSKQSTAKFCNIAHLLTTQYMRYDDSLFVAQSFMYLLLAFVYRWITWSIYIWNLSLVTYQDLSAIPILLLLFLSRRTSHANLDTDKKFAGSSSYISIHLLRNLLNIIMYHSACVDHDTHLNCIFWDPPRLFLSACTSILDISHCHIAVKLPVLQWCFIESLPTIGIVIWAHTFLQHQTIQLHLIQFSYLLL